MALLFESNPDDSGGFRRSAEVLRAILPAATMYLIQQFAAGLVIIHCALLLAYLCGSVLRRPLHAASNAASATVDVVISIGLGTAAIGFLSFFVGVSGFLSKWGFIAILLTIVAAGCWTREYVWDKRFWTGCFQLIACALRGPGLWLVWIFCIALAFPAAQPPTAFDALFFHQVYALEWAQHHAIFVDLYRRFPWYAQNWILIYAWFDRFHARDFVQFINWATYALSAALVYGLTRERLPGPSVLSELAAALSPLPFLLAPVFLRWSDTGMVDAALGFFFLLSVVVATRGMIRGPGSSWFTTAVITGFWVGMKPTLFVFLPLFAFFIAIAVRRSEGSGRRAVTAMAVLVVVSSPWYVKNLIEDHDPVPPMFNYLLHLQDGSYSRSDVESIRSASFFTSDTPAALIALPVRMFLDTTAPDFQEYGTTAEVLLLGSPFIVLVIALWKRSYNSETAYWASALVFAFAYWILTSHLARYAMLFYPLLTAFNVRLLIAGSQRLLNAYRRPVSSRAIALTAGIGSLLLTTPSPVSSAWLQLDYQTSYADEATVFSSREAYLQHYPGYPEEEAISAWLAAHPKLPKRVLSFRAETLAYFFAEHGILSLGDWIGPARYGDLDQAIAEGRAASYLRLLDVSAILIPEQNELLKGPGLKSLKTQLLTAGFRQVPNADRVDVYVRNS